MTHFLARLVERARGVAPHVEPVIAPHLAFSFSEESVPEISAAEAPGKMRVSAISKLMPAEESTPDSERGQALQTKRSTLVRRDATDPEEVSVRQTFADEFAPMEVVRETLLPPVETSSHAGPAFVRQTSASRGAKKSERTRVAEIASSSAARASEDGFVLPNESGGERPIVRVTIGRIDVHATPAPAAPARKTPKENPPRLTLDAYLKGRREGMR